MTKTFNKLAPEKQESILDAAAHTFAQKGFHQANVSDICKKAGISNGALYKYFRNKKDLYIKVFSSHIDRLAHLFDEYDEIMEKTDPSFFEVIEEILQLTPGYIAREKDYLKIYHDLGSAAMDDFTATLSRRFEDRAYRFWIKMVKRGQGKGEIRRDIDPDVAAYMVDNHFMIFNFSCVSEHYAKRFKVFFNHGKDDITMAEKLSLMKHSLVQLLT